MTQIHLWELLLFAVYLQLLNAKVTGWLWSDAGGVGVGEEDLLNVLIFSINLYLIPETSPLTLGIFLFYFFLLLCSSESPG